MCVGVYIGLHTSKNRNSQEFSISEIQFAFHFLYWFICFKYGYLVPELTAREH